MSTDLDAFKCSAADLQAMPRDADAGDIEASFTARGCKLVRRPLLGLPYSYTLCDNTMADAIRHQEVQAFFLSQVPRLARRAVGDSEAYVLLRSGRSVRTRATEHWHLFIVTSRAQKAWLYFRLAIGQLGRMAAPWKARRSGP